MIVDFRVFDEKLDWTAIKLVLNFMKIFKYFTCGHSSFEFSEILFTSRLFKK